jgi:NhaA family Na+:H+ antiporter
MRPISAGIAVPVFAFFASGVRVVDGGLRVALTDAVALGVIAGLVLGKVVGVFGSTFLVARFTKARLDDDIAWRDVGGLAMLTGVGFTVSLLIGELAFGAGSERDDSVKLAVLIGSLLSALIASVLLRIRNQVYRRIAELESRDDDADGIPDVYEREAG